MAYQLALLESEMKGIEKGENGIIKKMILRGKSFEEISEITDIPIAKLEVIAKKIVNGEDFD